MNKPVPAALLWVTLSVPLGACSTVQASPVAGRVDASLTAPCVDPVLTADPDATPKPTDNDYASDLVEAVRAYVACKAHHQALADAERLRGVK